MKKINIVVLVYIMLLCTIFTSCGKNADTKNAEIEPEIGYYVGTSGNTNEYEINPNAAKHPYNLELFIKNGEDVSYECDENFTTRKGVDVSKWQPNIDWEKVKAAGYEFAFFRLGYRGYQEGGLFIDETFYQNMENADKAGIDMGVYFFSQAVTEEEAIEEANFVLDALKGYEIQLPIVYDPEFVYEEDSRTKDLSGDQITKNTIAFCETIEKAGYSSMIYSSMYWQAEIFDMGELKDYSFWYADYMETPQTPYDFTYWQYSDTGSVDGIEGNVDLNIQFIPTKDN